MNEIDKDEQFYRDTESIAFPKLDDRQLALLEPLGQRRTLLVPAPGQQDRGSAYRGLDAVLNCGPDRRVVACGSSPSGDLDPGARRREGAREFGDAVALVSSSQHGQPFPGVTAGYLRVVPLISDPPGGEKPARAGLGEGGQPYCQRSD